MRPRHVPLLFETILVLLVGLAGILTYRVWRYPETNLEEAKRNLAALYYNMPAPEKYLSTIGPIVAATERALEIKSLHSEARQTRLDLFIWTLDPVSLKHELDLYEREEASFSSKDPVFMARQVLYELGSVPHPDSIESRRIVPLRAEAQKRRPSSSSPDFEWGRPILLKLFVEAKNALSSFESNSTSKALSNLDLVLLYAPTFAPARYLRGRALLTLERPADALEEFRQVAAFEANRPEAHYWAAVALQRLEKQEEGIKELGSV
jgi:tetratricopeptide (TPR) repeat protein